MMGPERRASDDAPPGKEANGEADAMSGTRSSDERVRGAKKFASLGGLTLSALSDDEKPILASTWFFRTRGVIAGGAAKRD